VARVLSDEDIAQAKLSLALAAQDIEKRVAEQELPADKLKLAKQVLADLAAVLTKTLESKKADLGLSLSLDPAAVTLVAGGMIADGDKLEKAIKALVTDMQKDEPALSAMLKLDADKHEGVRFHSFSMPTPDAKLAAMVGEQLDVIVGISNTGLYLAAGRDAAKALKEALDKSKKAGSTPVPPDKVSLAGAAIAKFAAAVAEGPAQQTATIMAGVLAQSSGKDHLTLVTKPIENGVLSRLEFEEGLLKLIGMGAQVGMGGAPPAP
jgi:hypothetical protein